MKMEDPIVRFVMDPTPEGFAALRCYRVAQHLAFLERRRVGFPERGSQSSAACGAWVLAVLAIRVRLQAGEQVSWTDVWATLEPAAERIQFLRERAT